MIMACGCKGTGGVLQAALFQDAAYGVGNRVYNPMAIEDMFRCTICGNEKKKQGKKLSKKEEKALREAEEKEKAGKNRR